jgi:hypothetical protein
VLFLDNVNDRALRSDTLANAITERPARVRPLDRTGTVPLNSAAFVAVPGNALVLSEDLVRRFLGVELDAGTEDPEARDFRGDLVAETLERRAGLLADLLTVWRWGRLAGDALPAGRPLGSFAEWARWCRDPLLALGCRDPVLRVAEAKAADSGRRLVLEVFAAWWAAHGEALVTAAGLAAPVVALLDPGWRGHQHVRLGRGRRRPVRSCAPYDPYASRLARRRGAGGRLRLGGGAVTAAGTLAAAEQAGVRLWLDAGGAART